MTAKWSSSRMHLRDWRKVQQQADSWWTPGPAKQGRRLLGSDCWNYPVEKPVRSRYECRYCSSPKLRTFIQFPEHLSIDSGTGKRCSCLPALVWAAMSLARTARRKLVWYITAIHHLLPWSTCALAKRRDWFGINRHANGTHQRTLRELWSNRPTELHQVLGFGTWWQCSGIGRMKFQCKSREAQIRLTKGIGEAKRHDASGTKFPSVLASSVVIENAVAQRSDIAMDSDARGSPAGAQQTPFGKSRRFTHPGIISIMSAIDRALPAQYTKHSPWYAEEDRGEKLFEKIWQLGIPWNGKIAGLPGLPISMDRIRRTEPIRCLTPDRFVCNGTRIRYSKVFSIEVLQNFHTWFTRLYWLFINSP